jgi:hypothetical protein
MSDVDASRPAPSAEPPKRLLRIVGLRTAAPLDASAAPLTADAAVAHSAAATPPGSLAESVEPTRATALQSRRQSYSPVPGGAPRLMSLRADPLRFRPPEAAGSAEEERAVAAKMRAAVRHLAGRLAAALPHFRACNALIDIMRDGDRVANDAVWAAVAERLLFGEIRDGAAFATEARALIAARGVAPAVENAFEEALHRDLLPTLPPAERAAVESRELTDADLAGLSEQKRARAVDEAATIDGNVVRVFWRKASYAARRRVRTLVERMRGEPELPPQPPVLPRQAPAASKAASAVVKREAPAVAGSAAARSHGGKKSGAAPEITIQDLRMRQPPWCAVPPPPPPRNGASARVAPAAVPGSAPTRPAPHAAPNDMRLHRATPGIAPMFADPELLFAPAPPHVVSRASENAAAAAPDRLPANPHTLGDFFDFEPHTEPEQPDEDLWI